MEAIEFTIPFTVMAKQNRIPVPRRTKAGIPYTAQVTPTKLKENSDNLAALMAPHKPEVPLDGPLRAFYEFRYGWLGKHSAKVRAMGKIPKDTRPDSGNLIKNLEDVLERMGFIADDARICDTRILRVYCDSPGVHVRIEALNGQVSRAARRHAEYRLAKPSVVEFCQVPGQ